MGGNDYPVLAELSPVPRADSAGRTPILDEVHESIRQHPQRRRRMRLSLAIEVLEWAVPPESRNPCFHVLDPMIGFCTTYYAARALGLGHTVGADLDPTVHAIWPNVPDLSRAFLAEDARETDFAFPDAQVLLTSPPFPNSKSEGCSAMQAAMNAQKELGSQGQNFLNMAQWRSQKAFTGSLYSILLTWKRGLLPYSPVLVHVRDFVKRNKRIEVWRWAVTAMESAGLSVDGRLRAPLGFRSPYKTWKRFPLRKVLERVRELTLRYDALECGHHKYRSSQEVVTKFAHCTECPEVEDLCEVMEEWIVVGEVVP